MILPVCVIAIASSVSFGQESGERRAWEFGLGGSAMNYVRTTVTGFARLESGEYKFDIEDRHLYGGPGVYVAKEITDWFYVDAQATFGLARYRAEGGERQGFSCQVGPGVQFRPFKGFGIVQPYLRLGLNYYHKDFDAVYMGAFDGDATKKAGWTTEDSWNKGLDTDRDDYFPVSGALGVVTWLSNRVGISVQAEYDHDFFGKGKNFAKGTVGLVCRLGGNDKRRSIAARYFADYPPSAVYVEKPVEVERIVERVVEKRVEVPVERTLTDLMENVNFEFDKDVLTTDSELVLDVVAKVLDGNRDKRFLVAGYTDAKGSDAYNDDLSGRRAKVVRDALVKRGIGGERLAYKGFGKRMAIVPASATDAQRRGDRKVVLEIVNNDELWDFLKSGD